MRNLRWIGLAFLFFSITTSAGAQVYKWIDEHGKTQYADRPPSPGEAKAEKKINIKTGISSHDGEEPVASKGLAEQKAEFEKRRQQRQEQEAKQQAGTDENKRKCIDARTQLTMYTDSPRLTVPDGSGGLTYVDEETRQKKIDEANKLIATFCK